MMVAWLRRELEQIAPNSRTIREFVISNGTLSGVAIGEPHLSHVVSECSDLLAEGQFNSDEYLRSFLVALRELAKTALYEDNPIVLI